MNIRTRKVLKDIWQNKARTALVVASIAVGLMAISTTFRAQAIFTQNLDASLAAINPASGVLWTMPVDDDVVTAVANLDTIAQAEGQQTVWARIRVGDEWRSLRLVALPDFNVQTIDKLRPVSGDWPPPDRTLLLERSSLRATGAQLGDTLLIETPDGSTRNIPIVGLAHDLNIISGELLDQVIFGYATLETLRWLGLSDTFTEIKFTVSDDALNVRHIEQVAEDAEARVEATGFGVFGVQIPAPGKHLMDNVIQSLLLILGSLGLLSLLLSAFLVFNTISALLARQVPQIGIMKAIGAPRGDIFTMYLATILIFSLLALLVAVPLGMLSARVMTVQLATLLNFDITQFRVPGYVLVIEVAVGLIVPLAAALVPIVKGTRLTVREAISSQGGGSGHFGSGRLDVWLSRLRGLPASLSYAARNIFRRKVRLVLTLITLSLGGAIFVTVLSVRASLFLTVNSIADYWQQDVSVNLQRPYRQSELNDLLANFPEVVTSEGWTIKPTFLVRPDGTESHGDITLFAVPPDSALITPTLLNGRWLSPEDENAVVINVDLVAKEPEVDVGDTITLRVDGEELDWQVVGISTTQMVGVGEPRPEIPMAYVPYAYLARMVGENGRVNRLALVTQNHSPAYQSAIAQTLDEYLGSAGILVRSVETNAKTRTQVENLTNPILLLLLSMAVLFALVGGLSLMGTMSLNVLERTQEIGIIRSLGGTSSTIMQIVIVEGVFVGLLSWVLATLLAYPLGWMMRTAVGISFIKVPLTYQFAPLGILLWLGIVIILAIIASYIPARNASRLVVREALAYE